MSETVGNEEGKKVDTFIDSKDTVPLVRVFLPPYSPELNPIGRVWRITRR